MTAHRVLLLLLVAGPGLTGAAACQGAAPAPASRVRELRWVGRYEEAEAIARREIAAGRPGWQVVLGDLAAAQGRVDEAATAYRAAVDADEGLTGRIRLGLLLRSQGKRAEADRLLAGAVAMAAGRRLTSVEWAAVGDAQRALGATESARVHDARRAYDAAIAADSTNLDARVAVGMLFLEKYNKPDAIEAFDGVLAVRPDHADALLGKALVADGGVEAFTLLEQSLAANPNLTGARVALAMAHLDRESWSEAEAEAGRALRQNPAASAALAVRASSRLLRGDTAGFEADRRTALTLNPADAAFYVAVAEASSRNRYYREAVGWAREAVRLDSTSAPALGTLALNELRTGAMTEGRRRLERAFALDPFNVWFKNTLDMLDVLGGYVEFRSARFQFLAAPGDAELLRPYLVELAEVGYDRLAARYGYRPPAPVRVELYRQHADFSVRTVGLTGLGALGVSFGTVLVMDAPSARPPGEFNWGSTFWHELAHSYTLGVTGHRVPRWFSEGLSVLEERRARAGWGAGVRLGFLRAYLEDRLLPVSRLNDGFVRPAYPEQVPHSYYQASLVCEMIEETRGAVAINAMLDGYRRGLSTDEVIRTALGIDTGAFDREFDAWFRARFRGPLAAVGDSAGGAFGRQLKSAAALAKAGQDEAAIEAYRAARELFPEYAEAGNPHRELARLFRKRGNLPEAAEALTRLTALAETDLEANIEEAAVREALGDARGAAAALERAVFIDPRPVELHERLAALYARVGEWRRVIREREAVVALDPPDRAEAWYQLALARYEAGDLPAARRDVLRALDLAPAFERAQELLLRIRERGGVNPPRGRVR